MGFQVSPGVRTTEIDLTGGVTAVATTIGAIAGPFNWGPVEEIRNISSEKKLVSVFGKPNSDNYATWFSASSFLAYTNALKVVRVVNDYKAKNATGGGTLSASANIAGLTTELSACTAFVATDSTFTQDVEVGDKLKIEGDTVIYTVTASTSDTALTLDTAITAAAGQEIYKYGHLLKNEDTYDATANSVLDDFGYWAAKYPGTKGNSLTVSICPSSAAYSSSQTDKFTFQGIGNLEVNTASDLSALVTDNSSLLVYNGISKKILDSNATHVVLESSFNITATTVTGALAWEHSIDIDAAPGASVYATGKGAANDELHIVITDNDGSISGTAGTVIERFQGLSKAGDAKNEDGTSNYYVDVINNQSAWIYWLSAAATTATNWGSDATSGLVYGSDATVTTDILYGGADGISTGYGNSSLDFNNDEKLTGYDLFKNPDEVDVSLIISANADATLDQYLIDTLGDRKDVVVCISPEIGDVVNNTAGTQAVDCIAFKNTINRSSSYAVMDCNWKYMYDKYNDKYRWIPCNADVAGIIAATEYYYDAWVSPGGSKKGVIKNAAKLAWNPNKSQRDILYPAGINPIISNPGAGIHLKGDKTMLTGTSAFTRIGVRRLFIVVEKSIANASADLLFEFNNEFTRRQFINYVSPFLRMVQGREGIRQFEVICDSTNNTPEVEDANEFKGAIFIKPTHSINFIDLTFVAVRSGVTFSEAIGQVIG